MSTHIRATKRTTLPGGGRQIGTTLLGLLMVTLLLAACETDDYDTGDGALSYLRADFVEAYTDSQGRLTHVVTDDDDQLTLSTPTTVSWMSQADTMYRALLYYNVTTAEAITVSSVAVPAIVMAGDADDKPTDPLYWDSSWVSNNGRYINLGMTLMLGADDSDEIGTQSLGMVCRGITTVDDTTTVALLLVHDQNGVPEYYSQSFYVSIPVSGLPCAVSKGDRVTLTVNTYDGEVTKEFEL